MTSRDPFLRLPSWLIAASLAVLVVATLTYFITSSNDNTDEAAPPPEPAADTSDPSKDAGSAADAEQPEDTESEPAPKDDEAKKPDKKPADRPEPDKKKADREPERKAPPEPTPDATVDVYNNSGITNLAASVSTDVRAAGFAIGGVDNWYGNIPESTVYYPPGMEEQARLLAGDLGLSRTMPAISPMSAERLSVILTAAI